MKKLQLGRFNTLRVARRAEQGLYLEGGPEDGILLPNKYIPEGAQVGDMLDVFLYLDQQERLIATTLKPKAQVGDFAWLTVSWVNNFGAFLDWGLEKDLFVPFREQKQKMQKGNSYIVHLHVDPETFRIVASAKVEHWLNKDIPPYNAGDKVDVLVWQKTELGFKAIADNQYPGLIYDSDVYRELHSGDRLAAYVKQVRGDGKLDLTLQRPGQQGVADFSTVLLEHIRNNGGVVPLGDKSQPEEIYAMFGVSKKVFKKAVGDLYKQRLITILPQEVRLVAAEQS